MIPTSQSLPGILCRILASVAAILVFGSPAAARSQGLPPPTPTLVTDIRVEGNERTETHVILREMQTQVGDPYDPEQASRDRDRIDNLDLFSEVRVDTLWHENRMLIRVRVKERLVWLPTEWIPYPILDCSDETGWTYGFGLTNPNESGRNRSFTLIMEGGGRRTGHFRYSDPWITGNHGSAAVSLVWSEYDDFEGQTNRWSAVGLGLGTYLGTWGRARLSLEGSEIETDAWRTASGTRRDRIRSLGMGMAYDTRDVYADPRSGAYAGGFLERSLPVFDGTVDYASYRLDVRGFRTVTPGRILAARASVRYRDRPVPDYRRLRLGGFGNVRGLHPLSFKGRNRILGAVEVRIVLKEKRSYDFWFVRNVDLGLMAALFGDVGSVWDGDALPAWDEFYGSVGAGIRILSQQVVRLEVAYSRRDGTRWIAATGMPF